MEQKFSDKQIQIFNASIELIGTGGIQMLTTKNIALKIKASEPIIYKHFKNKVELIQQLLDFLKLQNIQRLKRISSSENAPDKKIKQIFKEQFKAFSKRPEIVVVLLSEGLYKNEKVLSNAIYSIMQASAKYHIQIIKEGQAKGYFRTDIDAQQLAFIIMGSMRLFVTQWHLSEFEFDLNKKSKKLIKSIMALIKI